MLIKADFNFGNNIYFDSRMIKLATGQGLVLPEQHGLRDQNCLEVVLTKTLFHDIMNQKRWTADDESFNAHVCYDRVVHNYRSMSCQDFGVTL